MYRIITSLLLSTTLLNANSEEFSTLCSSGHTIKYVTTSDSTVEVGINDELSGTIVLPSSVTNGGKTYIVTRIANSAFLYNYDLDGITLPSTLTSIGSLAFSNCGGLTSISLPNGIKVIGDSAFYEDSYLEGITLPESLEHIGSYAFGECRSLTRLKMPAKVDSVLNNAFQGCIGLDTISLASGLKFIGEDAFNHCDSLKKVTMSDSLQSLGDYAFGYCASLTDISLPATLTSIGTGAFTSCNALSSINIAAGNPVYKSTDGILYAADGKHLIACPGGKTGAVVIPDSVTKIQKGAFENCHHITQITIPSSLDSIYEYTFDGCDSLKDLFFSSPSSLVSIGAHTRSTARNCRAA